jgi:hypothetical protein
MREITIGRGQDNDITINDASVSRHHATIIQTSSGIIINDNGSSNGTFINGNRINQESVLKNNDILKLGSALIPWMNYVGIKEESHSLQTKIIKEEVSKPNPSPAQAVESSNVQNQNVQQHVIVQQIGSPSNGLGTAGFVLGLLGFLTSWAGVGGVIGFFGLIFSFAGLFKSPRGLAIAGLILSLLGIFIALAVLG